MSGYTNYGGQQYNAPGGTQSFHGIPPEQVTMMVVALNQQLATMQAAIDAQARGITDAALQRFITQIAQETTDTQQAMSDLRGMLEIAISVQDEARQGSNLGDFVDEVLRRRADLSAEGRYEEAISELDAALLREESESKARQMRIISAMENEYLLSRNVRGAAETILRRLKVESIRADELIDSLLEESIQWFERGRNMGRNIDLRVSVALAQLGCEIAEGDRQRFRAHLALGNGLNVLGERETGTASLQEAVKVYQVAIELNGGTLDRDDLAKIKANMAIAIFSMCERAPDRNPDRMQEAIDLLGQAIEIFKNEGLLHEWASAQSSLGSVLSASGEYSLAENAYRAALEVETREATPIGWAFTLVNLASTLNDLGREREAVEASREAMTVLTKEQYPGYWASAQRNLAGYLADLGQMEDDGDLLQEAVDGFQEALEVFTKEEDPISWGGCTGDQGNVLVNLAELRSDVELAQRGLDQLVEASSMLREAGHIRWAEYKEAQIPRAEALVNRLKDRGRLL